MLEVKLNNAGYDPFIDFLKGLCIVWVVLTHSIPYEWQQLIGFPFWGAQAVPLFLLIQAYHYFKKETIPSINWKKLFKRIIIPFVIVQSIIVSYLFVDSYLYGDEPLSKFLPRLIKCGGYGPGSFYFWVYLQFVILLPCVGWLQKRINLPSWGWCLVFVVVSELLEILCSLTNISPELYRLCAFRYVFLIYGGYLWAKEGIKLKWYTILLSIFSIAAIYMLQYRQLVFEPWVFNTAWRYMHWFCYFYAIWLLLYLTNVLLRTGGGGHFAKLFRTLGKYSYEIFIFQMMVFYFFPEDINPCIYLTATTLLSIVPVAMYKLIREKCVRIIR